MPPLGAAAIAAIVGAVVSAGTGIASAVLVNKKGGGGEGPVQLNPAQRRTEADLANTFHFGKAGDSLNPNAQLGQSLVTPPNTLTAQAQQLQDRFSLTGPPAQPYHLTNFGR